MSDTARMPDFLIAGAMRSGTTSLAYWLRQHPSVFMATPKEVHYFDVHYGQGPRWYLDHFSAARAGQVRGEATPEYLFLPWARERMTNDLPGVKLVVTLRNPADRAWSHYSMLHERGRESLTFEQALDAETTRLRKRSDWSRYGYVAKGRYAEQLEDLFAQHGRDRVLVLIFERDVAARPRETFGRVCRFIGVDAAEAEEAAIGRSVNAAIHVRSSTVRDLTRGLPKRLRDAVGRLNTRPKTGSELHPDLRRRLESEFAESNEALGRLLGRPIPEWGVPTAARGPRKGPEQAC